MSRSQLARAELVILHGPAWSGTVRRQEGAGRREGGGWYGAITAAFPRGSRQDRRTGRAASPLSGAVPVNPTNRA